MLFFGHLVNIQGGMSIFDSQKKKKQNSSNQNPQISEE